MEIKSSDEPTTFFIKDLPKDQVNSPWTIDDFLSTPTKEYLSKEIETMDDAHSLPKTQKARGIYVIRRDVHTSVFPYFSYTLCSYSSILPGFPASYLPERQSLFIRPCPLTPKHGFVESREVGSLSEFVGIWREMAAIDPEGMEVVVMEKATSKWSAVLTDGLMVVGKGNDGATGGGGENLSIPFPKITSDGTIHQLEGLKEKVGVSTKDGIFAEIVEHRGNAEIVQLRGGPVLPSAPYFCPERVEKVERVVKIYADCDLVDLGEILAEAKKDKENGLGVVVLICGGGLASHAAVQSIVAGLPTVTSDKFTEDQLLGRPLDVPQGNAGLPTKKGMMEIKQGIGGYISSPLPITAGAEMAALVLHAQSVWGWDNHHLNLFRAAALIGGLRAGYAACLAEARHWWSSGPGTSGSLDLPSQAAEFVKEEWRKQKPERSVIYKNEEDTVLPLDVYISRLTVLLELFDTSGWDSNYGGKKWAACCQSVLRLTEGIQRLREAETFGQLRSGWAEAASGLNDLVHVSHNGGKLLTKFLPKMDRYSNLGAFNSPVPFAIALGWHEDKKIVAMEVNLSSSGEEDDEEDSVFEEAS